LTGGALTDGRAGGPLAADAAASPPMLIVDGVSKRFRVAHERAFTIKERALHPFRTREHHVLEALTDVSFELGSGEWIGVVGRNGSGKSTLLKCIAGIYRADEGRIAARGRLSQFIELGVGFNPNLRARDNVLLNGVMLGLSPERARDCFDEVIDYAGLGEFVDLKLKNYSSGMQVRLAFAVMVQVDADVLLIDEVLAVGDAVFQRKCLEVLERKREQGCGVVLVTHDMDAVERRCDRAVLLDRGHVLEIGDPSDVARSYGRLNFPEEHVE
jgi:ABC-2 type transport system ATP-binding protein